MIKNCYIHIPFCKKICSYCDFPKVLYNEKLVTKYLDSLEKEILSDYQGEVLETIYIGGGTPSALSIDLLKRLFNIIKLFNKSSECEFSIECNFDSINEEKLKLFRENGVNRLSFGIESIVPKNLFVLDRKESPTDIKNKIKLCRDNNFNNINVDLMYAISSEDLSDLDTDLDFVLSLDVEHISTYSLIIEKNTKLYINNVDYIDENTDYLMYKKICKSLSSSNYIHYEVSNFSKKGYFSKHNLCYWKNKNYYGFGLGASKYINNKRITNTRNMSKYNNGKYSDYAELLTKDDIITYEMILGLRLLEGIEKKEFKDKYGVSIDKYFDIDDMIKKGLLIDNDNNIYIPEDKIYISNEILINFIKE